MEHAEKVNLKKKKAKGASKSLSNSMGKWNIYLMHSHCLVTFNFRNNFKLSIWCDVLPMEVIHIVLRRSWLFYKNTYTLVHYGHKKILCPIKEIPPLKHPGKILASLKPEVSSNTPIKKQFKVRRKKLSVTNIECKRLWNRF